MHYVLLCLLCGGIIDGTDGTIHADGLFMTALAMTGAGLSMVDRPVRGVHGQLQGHGRIDNGRLHAPHTHGAHLVHREQRLPSEKRLSNVDDSCLGRDPRHAGWASWRWYDLDGCAHPVRWRSPNATSCR